VHHVRQTVLNGQVQGQVLAKDWLTIGKLLTVFQQNCGMTLVTVSIAPSLIAVFHDGVSCIVPFPSCCIQNIKLAREVLTGSQ
jgi:hypothetical protein